MDSTMSSNSVEISYENTFFLGEKKKKGREVTWNKYRIPKE